MATLGNALSFARAQSQTDSNGLTDANGIIFANEALVDFHRRLVDKSVDASQLQEAYTDGTANQGTYLYPSDMLFLKEIDLNYASTTAADYVQAQQLDVSNLSAEWRGIGDLRTNASTASPRFDDRGDWFEIFPTPTSSHNLTRLMRIFYYLKPTEYTTVNDTIAYPESQDYRILGFRVAANYKRSLGDFLSASEFDLKYQERVDQYVSTLARGSQQPLQAQSLQVSGWEF